MAPKTYPPMRWTPERIARFWDWQAQYPEAYFTYLFGNAIARSLRRYIAGHQRVLDYGCGVGYLLPHLCRYAPEVYGADPSRESVARTNERLGGTKSFQGAFLVSELRARETRFDTILAIEVIEHLDDAELEAVLHDIRAMLAPGGIAIFTTPNDEKLETNMILCPASGEVYHRWQHVRSWNRATLPAALNAAGFAVVEVTETNLAASRGCSPLAWLKSIVKRILLGDPGKPHLVCVTSLRAPNRA